jgi:Flp pilus assembly protein CpaB
MADVAVPRTFSRPRVDVRVVVGVFLMLLSVVGGASVIRHANTRTTVLVVARPLQPGEVISADDLRPAEVGLDPSLQGVVPAREETNVVGRVAGAPLLPGELLTRFALSSTAIPKGFVAMSVSARREGAVGGQVRSGDHVDVIATRGSNTGRTAARTLLHDVVVSRVGESSGLAANPGQLVVTLLIPARAAEQLAAAQAAGEIDLALLPAGGGS